MKIRELKKLLSHIKRVKNYIFDNIEVEKHKFHEHKNPISVYDVNINRIVVYAKFPFSKKVLNISLDTKIIMKNYVLVYITSKIAWI